MKLIDISTLAHPNIFVMVDDADFEWLNQWKWCPLKKGRNVYANRNSQEEGKKRKVRMHRLILGAEPGQIVDHADGNSLNNQRWNLRFCTKSQNNSNIDKPKHGKTSQYKGVYWVPKRKRFFAAIKINHNRIRLGYFQDERDAALAYNAAAVQYFGEFARINRLNPVPVQPSIFSQGAGPVGT
jgi:hypothetical protein